MWAGSWRWLIVWDGRSHWSRAERTSSSPLWSSAGVKAASPDIITSTTSSCTESGRSGWRALKSGSKTLLLYNASSLPPAHLHHSFLTLSIRPAWRSLISKLEVKSQCVRLLGKDKLVRLLHLAPGFIIGIWRVNVVQKKQTILDFFRHILFKLSLTYVESLERSGSFLELSNWFWNVCRVSRALLSSWPACTSTSWWRRVCWDLQPGKFTSHNYQTDKQTSSLSSELNRSAPQLSQDQSGKSRAPSAGIIMSLQLH